MGTMEMFLSLTPLMRNCFTTLIYVSISIEITRYYYFIIYFFYCCSINIIFIITFIVGIISDILIKDIITIIDFFAIDIILIILIL